MSETQTLARTNVPHPVIWSILYLPFGALGGFISVAMTFLATHSGPSITEGSLLGGAQMLSQWLKWSWAPAIDVTLTPKRWYVFSTVCSAIGVFTLAAVPLGPDTLPFLLAVVAIASLINSIVGMSIESILAVVTEPGQEGRVSAWFQAGNLGGAGLGGALGLYLLENLEGWAAGGIMGGLFLACCGALVVVPDTRGHTVAGGATAAVRAVFRDLLALGKLRGGLLAALLCFLPIGTGAAQGTLAQATVASLWGAGDTEVGLVQGLFAGACTVAGCFAGGWLCDRLNPRTAYALIGLALAAVGALFGLTAPGSAWEIASFPEVLALPLTWLGELLGLSQPSNPAMWLYIGWNMLYSVVVGLAYAAFTALVLNAIGAGSAATKYSMYASLSNFPIWWLGMLLGRSADLYGPAAMLYVEAGLAALGVFIFWAVLATWHEPADATEPDDAVYLGQRYASSWSLAGRIRGLGVFSAVLVWLGASIGGAWALLDPMPAMGPGSWLGGGALLGAALLFGGQVVASLIFSSADQALWTSPLSREEKLRLVRGVRGEPSVPGAGST